MKNSKVKNKRRTKTEKSRWFRRGFSISILIILLIFILILLAKGVKWLIDQFLNLILNLKFNLFIMENKFRENRYREICLVFVTNG